MARQEDLESRPVAWLAVNVDKAAVLLENASGSRKNSLWPTRRESTRVSISPGRSSQAGKVFAYRGRTRGGHAPGNALFKKRGVKVGQVAAVCFPYPGIGSCLFIRFPPLAIFYHLGGGRLHRSHPPTPPIINRFVHKGSSRAASCIILIKDPPQQIPNRIKVYVGILMG